MIDLFVQEIIAAQIRPCPTRTHTMSGDDEPFVRGEKKTALKLPNRLLTNKQRLQLLLQHRERQAQIQEERRAKQREYHRNHEKRLREKRQANSAAVARGADGNR